jgi:hypothetical protein
MVPAVTSDLQDIHHAETKAAARVAGDRLGRGEIGEICQERELAVKEFGLGEGIFLKRPGEAVGSVIGLEEAGKFGLGDGAGEATVSTAVGGTTAPGRLAHVLAVELADHLLGHGLEVGDPLPALGRLQGRALGIMGHDQAVVGEGRLGLTLVGEGKPLEGLDQFVAASPARRG